MKWIEICIESENDNTEEASAVLLDLGAGGTRIDNPDEIKSLIDEAGAEELAAYGDFSNLLDKYRTYAYFPASVDFDLIKGALNEKLDHATLKWREADDEEWSGTWKSYYKPFNITPGIRVVPSWESDGRPDGRTIIMDPGMAFGTGTHETTRLCALLVEKHIPEGGTMLDIGTGTGILAMIGVMNGASGVVALDIDRAAVDTAKRNLQINSIKDVYVLLGELKDLKKLTAGHPLRFIAEYEGHPLKFDLIAVNIVSDVIISLIGLIKKHLKEGGRVVCSGIISEREEDVISAFESAGFTVEEIERENEWTALCANA